MDSPVSIGHLKMSGLEAYTNMPDVLSNCPPVLPQPAVQRIQLSRVAQQPVEPQQPAARVRTKHELNDVIRLVQKYRELILERWYEENE